jgi:4-alpha-glucanotransferase
MDEYTPLEALARRLGVHTRYTDGLNRRISAPPETIARVCGALGASIAHPDDASEALRELQAREEGYPLPPVVVAWDGNLFPLSVPVGAARVELRLENGAVHPLEWEGGAVRSVHPLPLGYHRLLVEGGVGLQSCTVISAPDQAWRRAGSPRSWGVGTHLAALRSARSRSLGDLRDLGSVCRWVKSSGGDLVTVLPLLPTFNTEPAEPSPYAPVSRLFWSELILDLGEGHRPSGPVETLDVRKGEAEVREALEGAPIPDSSVLSEELIRYASFRGAQARMGRNWRDWPPEAKAGRLLPEQVDLEEQRFHLVAQPMALAQLEDLRARMEGEGVRLGLDLAVGVHPDGYDTWSRQHLFVSGMSVGAPPDPGFPSGQDWGFPPILPEASRREGHRYLADAIAHQAGLAGVLRIDHIMALTRLYWIPHGFGLHEGTYVSYPMEELFALITLESHRNQVEIVGENLGTVPLEVDQALARHQIQGIYVAQFQGYGGSSTVPPTALEVAQVGTHDTPTFAGWIKGFDIDERVCHGLLKEEAAPDAREEREGAIQNLTEALGLDREEPARFLAGLLEWLGRSESPLVVLWLEDLWLEEEAVNVPGTRTSERPNWQRPMRKLLEEAYSDPQVQRFVEILQASRSVEVR